MSSLRPRPNNSRLAVYVILDSNIYCQDYFSRNASFRLLIHYLNNNGYTLLLPRVVIDEVANVRSRKVTEELDSLRKSLDALGRLSELTLPAVPTALESESYDLFNLLSCNVDDIQVVEYKSLEHSAIFERALRIQRPFRPNEKGYRDTLLWLSFLDFAKTRCKGTEVIFITSNKNDFFSDKAELEFHPDLQKDLALLPDVKVTPYVSLTSFVEKEVDKEEHIIDRTKARQLFEEYLEEEALAFFSSVDSDFLSELGRIAVHGSDILSHATSVTAGFIEGLEDMEVDASSHLDKDSVYISCVHDFRIMEFDITVPESVYISNKAAVAASSHIYDIEEGERTVVLKLTARAYLQASFLYNRVTHECSGYSASIIGFK